MLFFRVAAPVLLPLSCASHGAGEAPCQRYEAQRAALLAFANSHQSGFLAIFRPCNGRGDPFHFIFPAARRRVAIPGSFQCYDDAQAVFERAVVTGIPRPQRGSVSVLLVHEGWVYANLMLRSDGTTKSYGGEPSYGITRELSQDLPAEKQAEPRGPIRVCDGVYLNELARGVNVAIPVSDENGRHLGEVQLITIDDHTGSTRSQGPQLKRSLARAAS